MLSTNAVTVPLGQERVLPLLRWRERLVVVLAARHVRSVTGVLLTSPPIPYPWASTSR